MGNIKEKEIMPNERVYTIRGISPATLTHTKLQLSTYDPKMMYQIIEFKIMPADNVVTDCYGTISMGKNDNIDPSEPNFSNQNEIAWAHHALWQNGTALPGSESFVISNHEVNDEKLFNYDIWMHTEDALDNSPINYFIKILRYSTSAVEGSIGSLRQFQYDQQGNV